MERIGIGLACVAMLISAGCLAAVAGGGAAGVRELTDKSVTYRGDIDAVYKAVRQTLVKDLGGRVKEVVTEEGKDGDRTIRGRTYDGEAITIDMEPTSPSSVLVEVRVGRIGSKARAKEVHSAIQKHLKPIG
jgi:hypothetical protein